MELGPQLNLLSSTRSESWKQEKLYFRGDDYFRDLLKSIDRSKRSVDIETYIFEKCWLGDQVVSALIKAVRRGVKIRLMVDGVGSPNFVDDYGARLLKAEVPFHVYRSWPTFFSSIFSRFRIIQPLKSIQRAINIFNGGKHRDHRKQYIVDETKIWIGSFNISDWHLERVKGKTVWRDTGICLSGVKSLVFRLAFHIAWEDVWPRHLAHIYRHSLIRWLSHDVQGKPIRMTVNRKLRRSFRKELLGRIAQASRRVWITTPYFVPTGPLIKALVNAAKRGCDVRLTLAGESDVPMVRWASLTFYPALLRAGCRIFEFQNRVLHAKTTFIDSWVLVGSGNLDYRSLRKDLEVNVIPQKKKTILGLERQSQVDLRNCKEVTLKEIRQRPWSTRALAALFFHFRYWF